MANDIKLANETTAAHWETIQQWRIDEGKNYARNKSGAVSRMAAGGQKVGSQGWNLQMEVLKDAHKKEKKRQRNSATQGILDKWTKDMKDFYVDAATPRVSVRQSTKGHVYSAPRQESTGRGGKGADPAFSYADAHEAWTRGSDRATKGEDARGPEPPKSYEEAVQMSLENGNLVSNPSEEGRALADAGMGNLYTASGLTEKQWRKLDTEQFMELQFGYTKKYKKDQDFSGVQQEARQDERSRQKKQKKEIQRASPWWG